MDSGSDDLNAGGVSCGAQRRDGAAAAGADAGRTQRGAGEGAGESAGKCQTAMRAEDQAVWATCALSALNSTASETARDPSAHRQAAALPSPETPARWAMCVGDVVARESQVEDAPPPRAIDAPAARSVSRWKQTKSPGSMLSRCGGGYRAASISGRSAVRLASGSVPTAAGRLAAARGMPRHSNQSSGWSATRSITPQAARGPPAQPATSPAGQ
jgi:hypothetical protein